MANSDFTFVKEFNIDFMIFRLSKNADGQYKTVCTFTDSGIVGEPVIYDSFEQLAECFEDEFTREELLS